MHVRSRYQTSARLDFPPRRRASLVVCNRESANRVGMGRSGRDGTHVDLRRCLA